MNHSGNYTLQTIPFFLCCIFLFCCSAPAWGASSPLQMETEEQHMVTWDLTADSVVTLNDSEIMEARGNVVLKRGNEYLKADFARYYMSTKWVFLQGHVLVRMGKDELKAEEAEFDLRSRVGWLKNGEIFMDGPHAYMTGTRIDKHWGDVYTFQNAKITTCDGNSPAWSLTAEEAVVELDSYARLVRSSFQVKDVPVMYTPLFFFPTKTSRQTGFLVPEYGYSNKKGLYYNQPYFWAINESSDLTVNEMYMSDRGFMHGIQYRTRPSSTTTGWIRGDWLHDDMRDTAQGNGQYDSDTYIRTNRDRFWLRGMFDTRLPDPNWRFKADLDYVSDQDYLNEFKSGMNGYKNSRNELFSLFNRELKERDRHRESGILLSRDWERVTVSLFANYTQNQWLGNGNAPYSSDTNVQRLPQFDAFLHRGRLFPQLPLEIDASAQMAYMYRKEGTRGARYDINPRLTLPLTSPYGSIIASTGLRHTIYNTESSSHGVSPTSNGPRETGDSRTLPDFSIAGTTEFARVFSFDATPLTESTENIGKSQYTAVKHAIQPRMELRYRPLEDQDDNPYYDDEDRLTPQTELVYSVTNVLTRKKESVTSVKGKDGTITPVLTESYVDLLRFKVEQAYDHREATRDEDRNLYARRPFGDVKAELLAYYDEYFYLRTKMHWSTYTSSATRHETGVGTTFPGYASFYVGYDERKKIDEYTRRRDSNIQYIHLSARTAFSNSFAFDTDYRYDFKNSDNTEKEFGITYNHQCFSVSGRVIVEPEEETYQLMFTLIGLGD